MSEQLPRQLPGQLLLPLHLNPQMDAEQFYVDASNTDAFAWVKAWPAWPMPGLVIYGPRSCGKTHLGFVFQQKSQAIFVTPEEITTRTPGQIVEGGKPLLIDDTEKFVQSVPGAPLFLLQLYNLTKEQGGSLLLLAETPPARWTCQLPDLSSRLNALPALPIHAPNDALLSKVLVKLFADLQLNVSPDVTLYLVRHMERSFASAQKTVARLNDLSLLEKRPITVDLCRRLFVVVEED